jgi:hypothetical protein
MLVALMSNDVEIHLMWNPLQVCDRIMIWKTNNVRKVLDKHSETLDKFTRYEENVFVIKLSNQKEFVIPISQYYSQEFYSSDWVMAEGQLLVVRKEK